jgi:hypothetical protein
MSVTLMRKHFIAVHLVASAFAAVAMSAEPRGVRFDRDIQPILAGRCWKCHGRDKAEAGLRLSDRTTATATKDSGARAIVPGRPEESELLRRVSARDANERMPPEGPPLTAEQIDKLRRWISAGAEWPAHWAYRPLTEPSPPRVRGSNGWVHTPIDRFILEKLLAHGLAPAPPTDKRTLLRRVYFDLVGLPPTPEELAAFLADDAPDAYERVVDRLLASPRYGERWARHWMDVVHYAETHGHDQDRPRDHAWPYRDYLIAAFNDDRPYSRFVQEQVAGDVLFPDEPQAIAATGFLATGPWDESSLRDIREDTLDREIARYLDRDDIVTTVMSTFASATVHCARCHDHKFDPISQHEYYGLQAVFAATDKGNRAYDADPRIAVRRRELLVRKAQLPQLRARRDASLLGAQICAQVAAWEKSLAQAGNLWRTLEPEKFTSANGSKLQKLKDHSLLSGGTPPEKDTYTIVAQSELKPVTGIRLEVMTDDSLPLKGPGRQDNGNLHLNEFIVHAAPRDNLAAKQRLTLQNPRADFNQEGWTIAMALDGNAGTAWGIYPQVSKPHVAVFEVKDPPDFAAGTTLTFELQQTHGSGHLIGRPRLSVTSAALPLPQDSRTLPPDVAAVLATPAAQRNEQQRADLAAFYLEQRLESELARLPKPQLIYCGTSSFEADGSFKPAAGPRPIHLLRRGEITQPGLLVEPAALSCVPNLDPRFRLGDGKNEGERRAALARWLADPKNILTWRSIVNRVWNYHFGRGIVDTPNDFGHMGGIPTHPELLDWLAVHLQRHGGSLKWLHRMIVTSAVYRQSSRHEPRFAEIDADNRFLWRMNRRRLDVESIRDALLSISGTLDAKMGGPSVKQFIQTPGIHVTPNVDYANFDVGDAANYRRSVYRFVFRTLPDPFMDALDCPDASQLTPQRNTSLTALQALAMLNDKFIVRQSLHIAERLSEASAGYDIQAKEAFRLILGRTPSEREARAIGSYAQKHGLANACRFLINSNEFMFVD